MIRHSSSGDASVVVNSSDTRLVDGDDGLAPDEVVGATPARTRQRSLTGRIVWWLLAGAVALIGLGAQIRVWSVDRGLWGDELYVADNVAGRGFVSLAGVLWHYQLAPVGWLWGERILYVAFGMSEQVLRFPSLLAGATVLVLGGWIATRAISRWAALAVMALIATSPKILEYSGEMKQYATEAAAALVVIVATYLGLSATGELRQRRRTVLIAAALGVFSAAISYSVIIVLTGATAGAVCWLVGQRRRRDAWIVAGTAAPGLLLGAATVLWRLAGPLMPDQDSFFPNGLPPENSGPVEVIAWLPTMWNGFVATPMLWQYSLLVLLLVAGGLVAMAVSGRGRWAAVMGGIFLVAVTVSAADAFPFEERVALYLVAPMLVAVMAAVDGTVRLLLWSLRRIATTGATPVSLVRVLASGLLVLCGVAAAGLSAQPAVEAGAAYAREPLYRDPFRDVMADVAPQLRTGDVVFVYGFSSVQAKWYSSVLDVPVSGLVYMTSRGKCKSEPAADALRGAQRVWYLKGAHFSQDPDDYQLRAAAYLQSHGTFVAAKDFKDYGSTPVVAPSSSAGWELFDLGAGPDPSPLHPEANPAYACFSLEPPSSDWS